MWRGTVKLELFLLTLDSDVLALVAAAELGPAVLPNLLELDGGSSGFSCLMEKPTVAAPGK